MTSILLVNVAKLINYEANSHNVIIQLSSVQFDVDSIQLNNSVGHAKFISYETNFIQAATVSLFNSIQFNDRVNIAKFLHYKRNSLQQKSVIIQLQCWFNSFW